MKRNISYLPLGKYEPRKILGTGAFGVVYLAKNKLLGRTEAIKEIHLPNRRSFGDAIEEAKRLEELRHRNIIEVYDAGYLNEEKGIYISMEYLKKGSVTNLGFISVLRLKNICLDVLSALEYAHSRNYIHRDIKPSNILIADDGVAKLSDFGIATQLDAMETAEPFGYKIHLAPESFRSGRYSIYSDIYAVGVTMHRLLNGDPPNLKSMTDGQLENAINTGQYPSRVEYRYDVPTKLIKLINRALELEPDNRFRSAGEMASELSKIKVRCEWILNENNRWIGITNAKTISIVYSKKDGEIITKQKQKEANSFRRINRFCFIGLDPSIVNQKLAEILRGFESGKYR